MNSRQLMMLIRATASHRLPSLTFMVCGTMLNDDLTKAVQFVVTDEEYEI